MPQALDLLVDAGVAVALVALVIALDSRGGLGNLVMRKTEGLGFFLLELLELLGHAGLDVLLYQLGAGGIGLARIGCVLVSQELWLRLLFHS